MSVTTLPTHFITTVRTHFTTALTRFRNPKRCVYIARHVGHALSLQKHYPDEWIGLPKSCTVEDLRMTPKLYSPNMCAVASFIQPFTSLDIIQTTQCSKLLVGTLLIHFDKNKHVTGYDVVELQ
jgi:hypothetical protein